MADFHHSNPNNAFVDIKTAAPAQQAHTATRLRTVSIYFCDWPAGTGTAPKNINPHLPRTVGVVVYALPSGDKLVPLTVIDDFASGCWVTFALTDQGQEEWPSSVRLRLTGIVGDGATLSAIAWDTVGSDA